MKDKTLVHPFNKLHPQVVFSGRSDSPCFIKSVVMEFVRISIKVLKQLLFFSIRAAKLIQWRLTLIGRGENVSLNIKTSIFFRKSEKGHFVMQISKPSYSH